MKLLFPSHPSNSPLPDPDYEAEVNAARRVGFERGIYMGRGLMKGLA